jgi:hypothetical protein
MSAESTFTPAPKPKKINLRTPDVMAKATCGTRAKTIFCQSKPSLRPNGNICVQKGLPKGISDL